MKKPKFQHKASVVSIAMTVAMVCLAAILVYSAVVQFLDGLWFSGCVSILGTLLVVVAGVILLVDVLKKKRKKQEHGNK